MKLPLSPANRLLAQSSEPSASPASAVAAQRDEVGRVRPSLGACDLCKLLPEPARSICEALC
ncbi:MAG: hypothetical protein U0836_04520 [Pirellulales bacterium]